MIGIRAVLASVILLMLLNLSIASATTTVTFQPGAYIIDMGSSPYTYANGLKPYGLVYDLIINKQIPVSWAINPSKAKDGIDFTVPSGTGAGSYRGGSFIIPVEFAGDALTTLNYWKNIKLVKVVGPTTAAFTAPIYENLTSFPNAVLDEQNGDKIQAAFYSYSEVPMSSYRIGSPEDLTECDDIYAMPHADPQDWAISTQNIFKNFINKGGDLWAACHAVSALEADTPDYLALYYLSQSGLIPWGDHDDAVPPYLYNAGSATHPIMQFIGKLDNSLSDGSEQVYIPDTTPAGNNWRSSTTVAVWDPDQADIVGPPARPGILAAKVAYGYAEGNSSKGFIVYEASHTIASGNISEDVCAARVYGNFVLYSGIMHRPNLTANVPPKMLSGSQGPVNVSITIGTGTPPYTAKWSSSCGGSFVPSQSIDNTPPYTIDAIFTAPTVTTVTPCIIRATVTDSCGRLNFIALPVTIYPVMMTLTKTDFKQAVQKEELLPYRIWYNNTGPVTAENVIITDLLPKGVAYIPTAYPAPYSVTYNGILNGTTTVVWHLGDVPALGKKLILLNATVNLTAPSPITNNVQAKAYITGLGPVYRTAQDVDIISPITKSVNKSTASAGDYLNYSICTRYDDPFLLKNATVKDTIPDYTTYVTGSANAGGTYDSVTKTIVWELGSNEPGISSRTSPGTNTINIPATYDMYVSNAAGGANLKNYGITPTLAMSQNRERALLYFSMSSIPPSATINSATFNAYVTTAKAQTASVRRLLKDWCMQANQCVLPCTGLVVEGTYPGAEPVGTGGYGSTWNNYLYKKTYLSCPWTTAGGDYDKLTSFGSFIASTSPTANKTVSITSLVQGWYAGTYAKQGIVLESSLNSNAAIASREDGTAGNRPQLSITYQPQVGSPVTITTTATFDTWLDANNPAINYGTSTTLGLRGPGNGNDRRALIYFTLPTLPAGATVTGANLYVTVTTPQATATITVRRMTRSWCTQADQCYNLCQNKLVEGRLNNNEPDQLGEGYGTVWNFYYYNKNSVACQWTSNSVLNDIGAEFGTFSTSPIGTKSATITNLVRGWYNGTYANQGVALTLLSGGNDLAAIASREATDPTRRPYIQVSYTVGQGTNNSITARPLLSCEGGQIEVKMTVNSSAFMATLVPPASLLVDSYNATVTLASGPTPAVYTSVPALSNRTFTYVYNVASGEFPGTVAFSGKPDYPTYFASAISNRLLVTPRLSYVVRINTNTPETVNFIPNTASFRDEAVVPLGTNSNEVITNLVWPRNIAVTKSANISSGVKCNNVLFTLVVKNTGIATLQTVEVVDTLPAGLDYVSSFNGSDNGQTITWANIGPLTKNQFKTLTFVAHINGEVFGLLNNTVNVTGVTANNNVVKNSSYYVVQALKTDISGTKIPNKAQGPPSTIVNYTVTMTNSGEATLSPAFMKDIFPHGMAFVNSTPVPSSYDPSHDAYFWNYTSLASGETKTVYMNVHLDGQYFGELCNPVYFNGKTPSGLDIINSTRGCVYVQEPEISLNKSSNFTSGDRCLINYSLNVTNTGEVTMNSVTLVDALPAGMQYISSTNGGVPSGSTVTWPAFSLAPGQSKILYLLAKINYNAEGPQENKATVTAKSPTLLTYSAVDWENFTAHAVAIDVNKGASPKEAGLMQNIVFTINVTNKGNAALNPVKVVDVLPDGLFYVDDNQTPKAVVAGKTITWANVGSLAAGEYTNISLIAQADGEEVGLLENTVSVIGNPEVGCDITDQDDESVTIYANANFTVVKTALNESVEPGQNAVFIINVTNNGEVDLPTVKVVDVLPIGLVYVSDDNTPPATVSGNLVTWNNVGPLAAGVSKFIKLVAKVQL